MLIKGSKRMAIGMFVGQFTTLVQTEISEKHSLMFFHKSLSRQSHRLEMNPTYFVDPLILLLMRKLPQPNI